MKNNTSFRPFNPLHQILLIAKASSKYWELSNNDGVSDIYLCENHLTILPKSSYKISLPCYKGRVIYPNVENAGVAGLYFIIKEYPNYNIIFGNDLAYEIHGIDALAYNKEKNHYLICEAKGTTLREKSPSYYLKKTKNRGRQLSWKWCWNCLIDFAEFPPTASVFLNLYKPFILGKGVKRILSVTFCQKEENGFSIIYTKIWNENDLTCYNWFKDERDFSKQRKWLKEIEQRTNV